MHTIRRFLKSFVPFGIFSAVIIFGVSCTKEYSFERGVKSAPSTIFTNQVPTEATQNDSVGGIELGVRFRSSVAGYVKGVRFYKTAGNSGIHTAELYNFDGALLASGSFDNETDTGWQIAYFPVDVAIQANTTYIAAYYSSLGNYVATNYGFNTAITNFELTGLADGADGINGLYKYSGASAFPCYGHLSNNYWVDVLVSGNADTVK